MDFKKERKPRPKLGVLLSVVISGALIFVLGYSLGFKILPEFVENQIWEVKQRKCSSVARVKHNQSLIGCHYEKWYRTVENI